MVVAVARGAGVPPVQPVPFHLVNGPPGLTARATNSWRLAVGGEAGVGEVEVAAVLDDGGVAHALGVAGAGGGAGLQHHRLGRPGAAAVEGGGHPDHFTGAGGRGAAGVAVDDVDRSTASARGRPGSPKRWCGCRCPCRTRARPPGSAGPPVSGCADAGGPTGTTASVAAASAATTVRTGLRMRISSRGFSERAVEKGPEEHPLARVGKAGAPRDAASAGVVAGVGDRR